MLRASLLVAIVGCSLLVASGGDGPGKSATVVNAPPRQNRKLPNNFGQLELSDAQKEKIYTIQARYDAEIDALEAQLLQLQGQRNAEIDGVLSFDQRKKLQAVQEEAKRKASAKKSKPKP